MKQKVISAVCSAQIIDVVCDIVVFEFTNVPANVAPEVLEYAKNDFCKRNKLDAAKFKIVLV